jgi:hypothetical protein
MRRNPIGFIPFAPEKDDTVVDEQSVPEEGRGGDEVLECLYEELFEQVRQYAAQLERVDPASYNAVQEVSKVMLAISRAVTPQERLQMLTGEAGRLMIKVAEAAKMERRTKWVLRLGLSAAGIGIAIACSSAFLP